MADVHPEGGPALSRRRGQTHTKGPTPQRHPTERGSSGRDTPAPSPRYTPKPNRGVLRPVWHKVVGALFLVAGIAVFALNDLAWFGPSILPGAHNEIYAVVALLVALPATWWFGWFDRPEGRW